jgi:hypothetical protein
MSVTWHLVCFFCHLLLTRLLLFFFSNILLFVPNYQTNSQFLRPLLWYTQLYCTKQRAYNNENVNIPPIYCNILRYTLPLSGYGICNVYTHVIPIIYWYIMKYTLRMLGYWHMIVSSCFDVTSTQGFRLFFRVKQSHICMERGFCKVGCNMSGVPLLYCKI